MRPASGGGSRLVALYLGCLLGLVFLCSTAAAQTSVLNAQELAFFNLMKSNALQKRPLMEVDPVLCQVARARAMDMAARQYVSHTNPDGNAANYLLHLAGFPLPASYLPLDENGQIRRNVNLVESLAGGFATAAATWNAFLKSTKGHRPHMLGLTAFQEEQTSIGIGYFYQEFVPGTSPPEYDYYRHYWVVITAPRPFSLTSIKPGQRITEDSVELRGACNRPGAFSVRYRVENANGEGEWQTALGPLPQGGSNNWLGNLELSDGLIPGANTLRVQARDLLNLNTVDELEYPLTYVRIQPLTVSADATRGTVTKGFLGTTDREVAKLYTITATAKAGWAFDHWSGSLQSTARVLTFAMEDDMTLVANFIPHPFLTRKGTYSGLLEGNHGLVRITAGAAGAFSGTLYYFGKTYGLRGTFDPQTGLATVTVLRRNQSSLTVQLSMDVQGQGGFAGTVTEGASFIGFAGQKYVPNVPGQPHLGMGRYTVRLTNLDPQAPTASGWATLTVTAAGAGTLKGRLPDGANFTATGTVTSTGLLPFCVPLYGGNGFLSGQYDLPVALGDAVISGTGQWKKPQTTAGIERLAINTAVEIAGNRWVKPLPGQLILPVNGGTIPPPPPPPPAVPADNVVLLVQSAELALNVEVGAFLNPRNIVQFPPPAFDPLPNVSFKINATTGQFSGAFKDHQHKLRSFAGVILQAEERAVGHFPGVLASGAVELEVISQAGPPDLP